MSDIAFYRRSKKGINIDISNRCPLECMRCQRQTNFTLEGRKVYGRDATMDEIRKLSDYFSSFNFCGQLSDPVHHPKFVEILEYLYNKDIQVTVHNASSQKPMKWYIKAFQAHPRAKWIFAIDGLPEESNMYRINQDGKKLYEVMLEAKKHLKQTPSWQFIVFSYNEHNLEKAKQMAIDKGLMFIVLHSSRWMGEDDPLRPKSKEYNLGYKGYVRPDERQKR
jgi:MoaA/NifB/PqqE/SkfB family radical SAM enzyme